ncbi:MAG TPA: malate synthase A, partial [Planctomycetota bacterium]|nr:malate synthase A [Planctomycetota bacterium]
TTEKGLETNVSVAIRYLESWLRGTGAVAINNLMEDAATAEISRSQVWQWVRHNARTQDQQPITAERVKALVKKEIEGALSNEGREGNRWREAGSLFERVALGDRFLDFLTLAAYEELD